MSKLFCGLILGLGLTMNASFAHAQSWTLDPSASDLSFGSIKKNTVGEVHKFERLEGSVTDAGLVEISIDLTSVQTDVDIRNERMRDIVFGGKEKATLTAQIDLASLKALPVGGATTVESPITLALLGKDIPVEAELFVLRLAEDRVMVSTQNMVFLNTQDAGINEGVDTLKTLAELSQITRSVPVTARFMFNAAETVSAAAAPAAPDEAETQVAMAGDAEAGKKVFRKCQACHSTKEGKNSTGPSLHAIFGRPAAVIEGFKYSKAMQNSGITWDAETMAAFLKKPRKYMPGTKMSFAGLRKDKDIENLLAYLAEATK